MITTFKLRGSTMINSLSKLGKKKNHNHRTLRCKTLLYNQYHRLQNAKINKNKNKQTNA